MPARCTAAWTGRNLAPVVLAASLALTTTHVCAEGAHSMPTGVSLVVFTAQASNEAGSGSYAASFDDGVWDPEEQTFEWSLPEPIDLVDETTGEWVAYLTEAAVFVRAAQTFEIRLDIGFWSGESLTTLEVGSPLLTFESVVPASFAQGRADASLTVSDLFGDGATLIGLGPTGSGAYRAYYNSYLDEGTRFSHLVGLISVGPGGTATGSQADPLVGFRSIDEDLIDISSEIAFTLTPNDLAYAVTAARFPEPPVCEGDVTGDGVVDTADLGALLACFGACDGQPNFNPAADLVEDGCIDIDDLVVLLSAYGETCW